MWKTVAAIHSHLSATSWSVRLCQPLHNPFIFVSHSRSVHICYEYYSIYTRLNDKHNANVVTVEGQWRLLLKQLCIATGPLSCPWDVVKISLWQNKLISTSVIMQCTDLIAQCIEKYSQVHHTILSRHFGFFHRLFQAVEILLIWILIRFQITRAPRPFSTSHFW